MPYSVKEIYYTLQGEGSQAGRPAVFCRFAGCNLWSGREADRAGAVCGFCDTDFIGTDGPGGGQFVNANALVTAVSAAWPTFGARIHPLVVCTGGEPLLQLDEAAIAALHDAGFSVAVETNGTRRCPPGIDHICVSPKAAAPLVQKAGHDLKLVFPQPLAMPERFADLDFNNFYLQPMDGPAAEKHTRETIAYCLAHPQWRLSLQTHKLVGLR